MWRGVRLPRRPAGRENLDCGAVRNACVAAETAGRDSRILRTLNRDYINLSLILACIVCQFLTTVF